MITLTVRRVGTSLGVTLPAQAARVLHVREGDKLFLTEAPGGFRLTPYDPSFAETMNIAGHLVDVSPLSTIGALCIASIPVGDASRLLFNQLLAWGFSMMAVILIEVLMAALFLIVVMGSTSKRQCGGRQSDVRDRGAR